MMSNCSQGWFLIRILALKRINWDCQPNARSNLKMRIRVRMSSISFCLDISTFVFLSVRAFLIDRFPLPFSLFVIIMWAIKSCLQWLRFWMQSPLIFLFLKQKESSRDHLSVYGLMLPLMKISPHSDWHYDRKPFTESVWYHRVINGNPRSPKWGERQKREEPDFSRIPIGCFLHCNSSHRIFCRVEHSSLLFSRRRRVQPSSQTGQWWLLEHPMADLTDFFFLLKKSAVMSSVFFANHNLERVQRKLPPS